MAESLIDLEDGYFRALCEVIVETERALQDISCIDAHYISQVVTVMASWQEVVQTAVTHMENANLTIYLAHREDAQRAMREYMAAVIKAREEHDTAHAKETEATCWVVCAQAVRAVDTFLKKIKETLHKHMPVNAQGPLIANTMSTAFQFQMSVWWMVGNECVHPL